jgi:predicted DCC family thiol-disulfide oxidoreductase YuxK
VKQTHAVILFDGVCNLCNRSVQFVIAHDRRSYFRFAPLQSETGQRLLAAHALSRDALETVVLIEDGAAYTRSDAALRIVRRLSGLWPLLRHFRIIPRPLRDWVYTQIITHRYQWFGKRDTCMVPEPGMRDRFLE